MRDPQGDRFVLSLLPELPAPWSAQHPPKYIHAKTYVYDFNQGSIPTDELNGKEPEDQRDEGWEDGRWWRRKVRTETCPFPSTLTFFFTAY